MRWLLTDCRGGSKGGREGRPHLPPGPISFIFMQFLGKFGKIVCWRTPTSGKSWIRHWMDPVQLR